MRFIAPFALLAIQGCREPTARAVSDTTADTTGLNPPAARAECDGSQVLWVAVQDGTGPWRRVAYDAAAKNFPVDIDSARGAYAAVDSGAALRTMIVYAARTELLALWGTRCARTAGTEQLVGNVLGGDPPSVVSIAVGRFLASPSGASSFSVPAPESGQQFDLTAVRRASSFDIVTGVLTTRPTAIIVRRGLTGPSLAPVDFNSSEAFAAAQGDITLRGTGQRSTSVTVSFATAGARLNELYTIDSVVALPAQMPIFEVPAARRVTDDYHCVLAVQSGATGAVDRSMRCAPSIAGADVEVPPDLAGVTVETVSDPTAAAPLVATYDVQPPFSRSWRILYYDQSVPVRGTVMRQFSVTMDSTYDAGPHIVLASPQFGSTVGWQSNWGLKRGTGALWVFDAQNRPPVNFPVNRVDLPLGVVWLWSWLSGSTNVP